MIGDTISIDNLNMNDKLNPTGDVLTITGTLFNPKVFENLFLKDNFCIIYKISKVQNSCVWGGIFNLEYLDMYQS